MQASASTLIPIVTVSWAAFVFTACAGGDDNSTRASRSSDAGGSQGDAGVLPAPAGGTGTGAATGTGGTSVDLPSTGGAIRGNGGSTSPFASGGAAGSGAGGATAGTSSTGGALQTGGAGPSAGGSTPSGWQCDASHYGTGDGCDCNCGVDDPDCNGAGTSSTTTSCGCGPGECGSNPGDPCTPGGSLCGCARCWDGRAGCCGGPPPSNGPHEVNCNNVDAHIGYDPDWCSCVPQDSNTGTTTISGVCRPDPDPWFTSKTMCCAEAGYPDKGACSCALRSDAWACYDESGGSSPECSCGFIDFGLTVSTVCNNVPDADGLPWVCCADSTRLTCDCYKNRTSCPSGYEVSDCISGSALGFTRPPSSCLSGHTALSSCAGGTAPQCTSDTDCPGSCTGTDIVCCPTCNSGHCGQYCCGSSGCF